MRKGIIKQPYWGFKVGDPIYIKESSFIYIKESRLTSKPCVNVYRTEDLSSFVIATWDMEMLEECVQFNIPLSQDCTYESETCDYYNNGECNKDTSDCPFTGLEMD